MDTYKKFSDFDLFGYNVGLYFNGSTKESTLFGIIFTIMYILSFIAVTIYYISEIFNRKNFSFSTSTLELEGAVSINLNKEIFALNFGLQDPITFAEYIDETIYNIKANLITGIRDPKTLDFSWNYEEIKTGPCSLDMFGKDNQKFFKDGSKNRYCLYDIDKKSLTGNYIFGNYSRIVISFYPCINNTENNNHCKPKNIINYYLNNTYVRMYLQSITLDEKQIPMFRNYIESPFTNIGQNFFRDYQVLLKIVETEDDTGIIINSKKYKKVLQFDYTINMVAFNRKIYDEDSFSEITIKLSDKKTIYKRKYDKIHNAFSKAGSVMTLICTLIQFCSWLAVKTVYEVNVINKVFRFDMKTATNKKTNDFHISRYLMNSEFKKNISNSNILNIDGIKNEKEENYKEENKDNNANFKYSKSKSNSNSNKLINKTNHHNNLSAKHIQDNSCNMFMNEILRKRTFNINKIPNIYSENNNKEDLKNNKNKFEQRRSSVENVKHIVDFLKFNYCQLLCYHPIKHCSNNIKINLAKNAQKYFRKTLDIISVFQNVVISQKISKLVLKNQRVFGIYDNKIYYNRPIISNDKIEINNFN